MFQIMNTTSGHYDPFLSRTWKSNASPALLMPPHSICRTMPSNDVTSSFSIQNALSKERLVRCQLASSDCHDSLFESIAFLIPGYDMLSLRKCASQTFCNSYLGHKTNAIDTLQTHLLHSTLHQSCIDLSWKTFIINMSKPYYAGYTEGGDFALQWLFHMLDVNIHIWSIQTQRFE